MSKIERDDRAHAWGCPVVMKTAPDFVAFTCGRCGAIATVPTLAPPPAGYGCPGGGLGRDRPAALARPPAPPDQSAENSRTSPATASPELDGRTNYGANRPVRRSPNCFYLGDSVLVTCVGASAELGTIMAFCGPLLEISIRFRSRVHVAEQSARRVPWEMVRPAAEAPGQRP